MVENYPRGVCCHEPGHAVVAWSFGLHVESARIMYTEEKGWHGCTVTGSADHLQLLDQVAVRAAGYMAENVFDCPAHETADRDDLARIAALLVAHGIPDQEHPTLRAEANERAEVILKTHSSKVHKLTERLVESGHLNASQFLNVMQNE